MRRWLVCAVLVTLATPAMAATRVGVVDFEKLFTATERARADRAELDRMMAARQAEVDARKARLAQQSDELNRISATMEPVARARREAQLDAERAALRQLFDDAQAKVAARERELSKRVVDDAKQLMPELARARGVQLVLGAAEALLWAAPDVVQVDLTQEISRALDLAGARSRAR